jgi:hypothetical protein
MGFDHVAGQPSIPPRALDVHNRTVVTFQSAQPSALGTIEKFGLTQGREPREDRHLSKKCRTSVLNIGRWKPRREGGGQASYRPVL